MEMVWGWYGEVKILRAEGEHEKWMVKIFCFYVGHAPLILLFYSDVHGEGTERPD